MASGPGIVVVATGISFVNEWYDTGTPNFRIPIAGMIFAMIDAGLSDLSDTAGKGLATIMLITVLLTPFNGKSPVGTLASLEISRPTRKVR